MKTFLVALLFAFSSFIFAEVVENNSAGHRICTNKNPQNGAMCMKNADCIKGCACYGGLCGEKLKK